MNARGTLLALAAVAATHCGGSLQAAPAAEEAGDSSPWTIGIAFGYGKRTNPLLQSDDIPVLIDIDIAWYGERWFFDNGDVGRTLIDNDRFTLNVTGRLNSEHVFFSKTDTEYVEIFGGAGLRPMDPLEPEEVELEAVEIPDRDYAFEAGIELLTSGDWGFAQVALYHDVSRTHDGYELSFDFGQTFRRQRWFFEPSIGLSYKSNDLNDYYWGVRPEESNAALWEYEAGAGWNTYGRFAASYQLTRNWTFVVATKYERLSSEAWESPLAAEPDVKSAFAGFSFRF